ncbi:hypothetical protein Droror1_Dr00016199, partial [Drosera rotundifolia]
MPIFWRIVGLKGTVQVERGIEGGRHGYLVLKYDSDGQSTSSFYPFYGVTEDLKVIIYDISKYKDILPKPLYSDVPRMALELEVLRIAF